ncbi:hypothetical protein HanRHA438_Chr11g0520781 [Helianthus annuus]|nr:hypothetical protein HanRHA438_Chr11g0520781 [Helianthus annuus]
MKAFLDSSKRSEVAPALLNYPMKLQPAIFVGVRFASEAQTLSPALHQNSSWSLVSKKENGQHNLSKFAK